MASDSWFQSAVVYQIYPLSFLDSNHDGRGDLRGIIEKLDYLNGGAEALGINAIWLSPIYQSPLADFGYDVSNYCDINPIFGTLADFEELVKQAHQRGIKIIMDFVPNHTSNQHPWFIESASSRTNPKRDWYLWRDGGPEGTLPNNWLSVFGGSGWEFDQKTHQYYFHSFLKEQPDLNWHNPQVREAMKDSLRFWLQKGVDGFRVDAVHWLGKDPALRDDPPNHEFAPGKDSPYNQLIHRYSQGHEEIHKILKEFCGVLWSFLKRTWSPKSMPTLPRWLNITAPATARFILPLILI